uniref:Uncharacterized protein n=1 Tax=Picea glauca TaxID=3330 RepID=A0A124GMR5_PICGL|nr:hypothetical protein ABT39_MTgene1593 [Picea glauca]QHR88300.1 hypothetical protein Q903MT_gene2313 [Picea sitchensis]
MPIVELSFARMDRLLGWLTIGCQEIKSSKALMRVTHRMGVQLRLPSIDSYPLLNQTEPGKEY